MREVELKSEESAQRSNWLARILTDAHFWVPVIVLLGGLLLLSSFH